MKTFAFGVSAIAALLGFLVGASESPVAGIALTAAFGLVASAISLKFKTSAGEIERSDAPKLAAAGSMSTESLQALGLILFLFAITFAVGLGAGVASRLSYHKATPETAFPWQGLDAPKTAKKAVDWILVRKRLRDLGYTDTQIQSIYAIDLEQATKDKANPWRGQEMLSPILKSEAEKIEMKEPPYVAWDPMLKRVKPFTDG